MVYFTATPIGNIRDITCRAIEEMKRVDYIICEDTRRTGKLLNHYNIDKPMKSYNDYNKKRRTDWILERLREGKDLVFVSSAGTPIISDPGYYLLKNLIKEGFSYTGIPGPSAVINAVVLSGFPPDRFIFEGYLPRKKGRRKGVLEGLIEEERTTVIYESPRRIERLLSEIESILPEREVCVIKEMTKMYQDIVRGKPREILKNLPTLKGEFVVLIGGCSWNGIK